MKTILNTPVGRQIESILASKRPRARYTFEALVHTSQKSFRALRITNIDFLEDPENNISVVGNIELLLEAGDFFKYVLTDDEGLEISLRTNSNSLHFESITHVDPVKVERFKAVVFDKEKESKNYSVSDNFSRDFLNDLTLVRVKFQIISKSIEQLKGYTLGGVFRNCTSQELLEVLITNSVQELELEEEEAILGVDMVDASNQEVQDNFIIPQGTRLFDLPDFIQNYSGGVYNSGIGSFIKNNYWYIYPKYDVKRFGSTDRVITIIVVDESKLPGVDKTYLNDGDSLTILCTGQTSKINSSETNQMNKGTGTRFANSSNFLEDFVEVSDNKALLRRAKNASEFITVEREDSSNVALLSDEVFTSNPFKHYSELSKDAGNLMTVVWENSDHNLIEHGTLVRVFTTDERSNLEERRGVILSLQHSIMVDGNVHFSDTFVCRTAIAIFIDDNYSQEDE